VAVFVTGSTAKNMGTRDSDLDLVIVFDKEKMEKIKIRLLHERPLSSPSLIERIWVEKKGFEAGIKSSPRDLLPVTYAALDQLRNGALPIHGKEYANQHTTVWNKPSLSLIRKSYKPSDKDFSERLSWKKSQSRRWRFKRPI